MGLGGNARPFFIVDREVNDRNGHFFFVHEFEPLSVDGFPKRFASFFGYEAWLL
jgi:hypothetical protein